MTNYRNGPPDGEGRPPQGPANVEGVAAKPPVTNRVKGNPNPRLCAVDALRRRRRASYRCVPLDCGCRDPWPCRCTEPPLSEKFIDAGRDAAQHLLEHGQIPLLEVEVLQALWRRGGDDRALAVELHRLSGGRAA